MKIFINKYITFVVVGDFYKKISIYIHTIRIYLRYCIVYVIFVFQICIYEECMKYTSFVHLKRFLKDEF